LIRHYYEGVMIGEQCTLVQMALSALAAEELQSCLL